MKALGLKDTSWTICLVILSSFRVEVWGVHQTPCQYKESQSCFVLDLFFSFKSVLKFVMRQQSFPFLEQRTVGCRLHLLALCQSSLPVKHRKRRGVMKKMAP